MGQGGRVAPALIAGTLPRVQPHVRVAELCEALAAIACGVTVAELRDGSDRREKPLMARRLCSALLKDQGLSWPDAAAALTTLRRGEQSARVLRDQRDAWLSLTEAATPIRERSALALALVDIYERTIRAVRLRVAPRIDREAVA